MRNINEYVEQTTSEIQDLLKQAKSENDWEKLSQIFDKIGLHADKFVLTISKVTDVLSDREEQTLDQALQSRTQRVQEREKVTA